MYKKELDKMLTSNSQEKGKVSWHKKKQSSDLLEPQSIILAQRWVKKHKEKVHDRHFRHKCPYIYIYIYFDEDKCPYILYLDSPRSIAPARIMNSCSP